MTLDLVPFKIMSSNVTTLGLVLFNIMSSNGSVMTLDLVLCLI